MELPKLFGLIPQLQKSLPTWQDKEKWKRRVIHYVNTRRIKDIKLQNISHFQNVQIFIYILYVHFLQQKCEAIPDSHLKIFICIRIIVWIGRYDDNLVRILTPIYGNVHLVNRSRVDNKTTVGKLNQECPCGFFWTTVRWHHISAYGVTCEHCVSIIFSRDPSENRQWRTRRIAKRWSRILHRPWPIFRN